jgi:hypothetical protein
MSLIFDLEMMQIFGGKDQLDSADEVEVQRLWLAFQARLDAQAKMQASQMPKT